MSNTLKDLPQRPYPRKRQALTAVFGFILLAARTLWAGQFWEEKPFLEWTREEARRLLIESPWAARFPIRLDWQKRPQKGTITWKDLGIPGSGLETGNSPRNLPVESPVGGLGAPKSPYPHEATVILRWMSATPLRQAEAIERFGPGEARSHTASQLVDKEPEHYILELVGLPAIVAHRGTAALEAELAQTTTLVTRTGRQIPLETVQAEIRGLYLAVIFRFRRDEPIRLEDRWVECSGRAELFEFRRRFELRSMIFRGRLDL